jgi:transposase-like protein
MKQLRAKNLFMIWKRRIVTMATKKGTRTRRIFTVEEKLRAVLSVWTERRTGAEICKEMNLHWGLLDRWQNQAMEGMLSGLEPKKKEPVPVLNGRLSKLLEKKLSSRNDGLMKLEERLETVQQKRRNKAS